MMVYKEKRFIWLKILVIGNFKHYETSILARASDNYILGGTMIEENGMRRESNLNVMKLNWIFQ